MYFVLSFILKIALFLQKFTPSIAPNFDSYSRKKHKKWRHLHRWQKFYTAAGSDGIDKFHLCQPVGTKFTFHSFKSKFHLEWCRSAFVIFLPQSTPANLKLSRKNLKFLQRTKMASTLQIVR